MKTSQFKLAVLCLTLTGASLAWGAEQSTTTSDNLLSNRSDKRIGAYLGILGDPVPTLVGINGAYNVTDYLRGTVGFGQVSATTSVGLDGSTESSSMTTIGAGVKGLMPGWNLSPALGLGYSHVFGDILGLDFAGDNIYSSLGLDWQSAIGFNAGVGMNLALVGGSGASPYLNLGWYF